MASTTIESLPSEIQAQIASYLNLTSAIAFSQVCRAWRNTCKEMDPFTGIVCQLLHKYADSSITDRDALVTLARRNSIIRPQTYIQIMGRAQRDFLIHDFEQPHLNDKSWQDAFDARFPSETKAKTWYNGRSWRNHFWSEINRLQHLYITGCTKVSSMVTYFLLYRPHRLTINRTGAALFNADNTFNAIKAQSAMSHHITFTRVREKIW